MIVVPRNASPNRPYVLIVEREDETCTSDDLPFEGLSAEIERFTSPLMARRGITRWSQAQRAKGFTCEFEDDFTLRLEKHGQTFPIRLRAVIVARRAAHD